MNHIRIIVIMIGLLIPCSGMAGAQPYGFGAGGQTDNWNVYCTGDRQCCAVAYGPSGDKMFPQFTGKVDWDTAWNWMNTNGYGGYGGCLSSASQIAVWNVYCDGGKQCCALAEKPSGDKMFSQFTTGVDWNTAWNWMNTNGYGGYGGCLSTSSQAAVWNVYCDGGSQCCAVAEEPSGDKMFPQFTGKVDWDTAWNWMNANGYGSNGGCRSGSGGGMTYPDLSGTWYMGGPYNIGMPCQISQDGATLVFTNEKADTVTGKFIDSNTVEAIGWNGLRGTLSADNKRIDWANGTWWTR